MYSIHIIREYLAGEEKKEKMIKRKAVSLGRIISTAKLHIVTQTV